MKTPTNWTEEQTRFMDNNTPFAELKISDGTRTHTVRMYWTTGGIYGPQVAAFLWLQLGKGDATLAYSRTSGCGYDKPDEAWRSVCEFCNWKFPSFNELRCSIAHIGGNFYMLNTNA